MLQVYGHLVSHGILDVTFKVKILTFTSTPSRIMHPINRTPGPILAFAEMDTLGPSWKLQKNQAQFLIQKWVLLLLPELFPSKTLRPCVSIFIFLESINMFKKNKTVRWA
jgi:hypothetical protein